MRPLGGSLRGSLGSWNRSGRLHERGFRIGCGPELGLGLRFGNGSNGRFSSLPGFGGRCGDIGCGRFTPGNRLRYSGRHGFRFSRSLRFCNSGRFGTRGRRKSGYRFVGNGFVARLSLRLYPRSCSSERRFLGDLVQRHGLLKFGVRHRVRIERQHLAQIQRLGHFERFGNGFRPDIPHRFRCCRNFRQCIVRRRETKGIVHPAQLLERQVALQSIDSAGCTPAINQLRQFLQSLLHTCQIHSRIHFASKDRKKFRNTRPPAAAFFREHPIFGPKNDAVT